MFDTGFVANRTIELVVCVALLICRSGEVQELHDKLLEFEVRIIKLNYNYRRMPDFRILCEEHVWYELYCCVF